MVVAVTSRPYQVHGTGVVTHPHIPGSGFPATDSTRGKLTEPTCEMRDFASIHFRKARVKLPGILDRATPSFHTRAVLAVPCLMLTQFVPPTE
ncbi:hypothetical protein J6590_084708 [Homalodisca vitripennis]|nr:hypothetical protein J6590_084708 [Homalodisca vitripennis]